MSKWFFINLAVLLFATWKVTTGYVGLHVIIGAMGLLLVLYNWTRHAVYSTIRSNINRERKIKFAKMTKSVRKYHQWVGTYSLLFILFHGLFALYQYNFHLNNFKVISGLIAMIILAGVVITGWRRKWKKTRHQHIIHLSFGFGMFAFILIHLIV